MVSTTRRSATRDSEPFKKIRDIVVKDDGSEVKEDYHEHLNQFQSRNVESLAEFKKSERALKHEFATLVERQTHYQRFG